MTRGASIATTKPRRPRRGQGEDSIYKDGDRWRGAISLGYNADGKRVRKKVSGETREEVARKLRQLREQLEAGAISAG
jgi:integrase